MYDKHLLDEEIVVIGMSCMLPQADNADSFWNNMIMGKDCIVEISRDRWNEDFYSENEDDVNKSNSKWMGEVTALKEFDNKFFNFSPAETNNMDPDQRVLLQETWKCIEDSGVPLKTLQEKSTAVIVGTAEVDAFGNQHMSEYEINAFSGRGLFYFMIPNRVSWFFGFSGESKLVETGCPSGLCALNDGVNLLKSGKSDFAIVSGVNTYKTSNMYKLLSPNGLFSLDGKCKTFSADADGIVISEGVVTLLLAPMSVAKKNNYNIYGTIKSTAVNHVGKTFSITAPKVSAQVDLITSAWRDLKFSPDTINYIETHGTGTSLGDPIEVEAIKQAYTKVTDKKRFCWLGSAKANIGHALPVSGLAGVVKVLKMFENKMIPKQINISEINPLIDIEDSPFNISTENLQWKTADNTVSLSAGIPLRAGVTSLGFAGVNAHVVLEEYKEDISNNKGTNALKNHIFILSAKTKDSLLQILSKWNQNIVSLENKYNRDNISYTLCSGREQFGYRYGCILKEETNLVELLGSVSDEDIKETTERNHLLNISIVDREVIEGQLINIIKQYPYFQEVLALEIEGLGLVQKDLFEINSYPSEGIYYLAMATAFLKGILGATYNINGIQVSDNNSILLALLVADVISLKDAKVYLENGDATCIKTKVPTIAINFLNKIKLEHNVISEKYLTYLITNLSLDFKSSDSETKSFSQVWMKDIRLLYKYQRTFKKYISEVNELFKQNDSFDLIEFIQNEDNQLDNISARKLKLMIMISLNIAIKRLYEKWSLTPQDVFYDERLNEISDLVINKSIALEQIVNLYSQTVTHIEQINHLDNKLEFFHSLQDILSIFDNNDYENKSHEISYNILEWNTKGKTTIEELMMDLWLKGVNVNWSRCIPYDNCRLVPLPTYCFQKTKFKYIQQEVGNGYNVEQNSCSKEDAKAQQKNELLIKSLEYKESELTINDIGQEKVLIFSTMEKPDFQDIRAKEKIYVQLSSFKRITEQKYAIQPNSYEDCLELFNELSRIKFIPDVIIVALNDTNEYKTNDDYLSNSFLFAANLAKCLIHNYNSFGKVFFSTMGYNSCLYSEGLTALFKTLLIEYETLYFRNITYYGQDKTQFVSIINAEMNNFSQGEYKVSYYGLRRKIQNYTNFEPVNQRPYLREDGVYILLGGYGGIGKIISEYIVKQNKVKLILCGRTSENAEIRSFIKKLNSNNSSVVYKSVDISNTDELSNLIYDVLNEHGTINGIFNMTGFIQPGFIETKNIKYLRDAIRLKVDATILLDEITKDVNLDFFINFSSVSAVLGDYGLSEYVYANCFFDEFIIKREDKRRQGNRYGLSISMNWPYWTDGGLKMSDKDYDRFSSSTGLEAISTKDALIAFDSIMNSNISGQYCILYGKVQKMHEYIEKQNRLPKITEQAVQVTTAQCNEGFDIKQTVEGYISSILAKELSLNVKELDTEENFMNLGVDSIMIHKLNRILGTKFSGISTTMFFDYKNIDEVVNYIMNTYIEDELKNIFIVNQRTEVKRSATDTKTVTASKEQVEVAQTITIPESDNRDIAVIGMSGRYPNANSIDEFWKVLRSGIDCISEIPKTRWNIDNFYDTEPKNSYSGKMNSKWGGFVEDVDQFDPMLFQISPLDACNMDPQERMLLEVVYEALEYAGYSKKRIKDSVSGSVGVYIGNTTNGYRLLIEDEMAKGNGVTHQALPWSLANRISYVFELNGPSFAIDSACSSSLNSVVLAVESLRNKNCKIAIAGGVNLHLHPSEYILRSQLRVMSPTGKCHSFGSEADGYVPGEGIGAIILKPLIDAEKDGDNILGVIKGVASNHVGHPNGYTVPSSSAQASVIKSAIEDAQISARDITYIEAHGTGTILGDPIEINGLKTAFDSYSNDKQYCAIGSVKTNIGHLEGAAGISAVTKVLLQLINKTKTPLLNCDMVNTGIHLDSTQFYLQKEAEPWTTYNNILTAGISSFGAGGSNAHVIIQNYIDKRKMPQSDSNGKYPVLLSEMTEEGLKKYASKMLYWLNKVEKVKNTALENKLYFSPRIEDIAYTTQVGRELLTYRICVTCSSIEELKKGLNDYLDKGYLSNVKVSLPDDRINLNKSDKQANIESANIAVRQGDIEELSRLALMGTDVNWKQYNTLQKGNIIMLPTYVFDHQKYWLNIIENKSNEKKNIDNNTSKLSFLLDANISTIESQKFIRRFYSNEFFVQDHVINGKAILPGTAIIEMAIEAGNLSVTGERVTAIKDVKYYKAIELGDTQTVIQIELIPEEEYLAFKIYSFSGEESLLCSEGKLYLNTNDNDNLNVEIPSIDNMNQIDSEDYYKRLNRFGFNFQNTFKPIEALYYNKECVMAEVSLTAEDEFNKEESCILWPPLIDGVLQSTFKLVDEVIDGGCSFLPVSIGEINICAPIRGNLISFAKTNKKYIEGSSDFVFDVYAYNSDGVLCLVVQEYTLVKVNKGSDESLENSNEDSYLLEILHKIQTGELDKDMLLKLLK